MKVSDIIERIRVLSNDFEIIGSEIRKFDESIRVLSNDSEIMI